MMINVHWFILVLLICIMLLYILNKKTIKEGFLAMAEIRNEEPLVYKLTYVPKKMLYINNGPSDLERISIYRPTIQIGIEADYNSDNTLQITDAYTYAHNVLPANVNSTSQVITMMPDTYVKALLFLQRGNLTNLKQVRNKKLGVLNALDRSIATIILESYGIRAIDNTFIEFATPEELLSASNGVDVMVVYASEKDKVMKQVANMLSQVTPISYDDVSMATVHIWVPFAKKALYEVKPPVRKTTDSVIKGLPPAMKTSALIVDTLLYSDVGMDNENIIDVINYINQPSKNGFFSQYFTFNKDAIDAMRDYALQLNADSVEGFVSSAIDNNQAHSVPNFDIQTNVSGTHVYVSDGDYYELHVSPQLRFSGLLVRPGDRIKLNGQDRAIENGYYYVQRIDASIGTILTSALVLQSNSKLKAVSEASSVSPGDEIWIVESRIRGAIDIHGNVVERPVSQSMQGDNTCFEDRNLVTQKACEERNFTWDAPCKRNDACPYYQNGKIINDNQNYNGGCDVSSGICEMPLGVKRKGFTKIDDKSMPYYNGCFIEDVNCKKGILSWE